LAAVPRDGIQHPLLFHQHADSSDPINPVEIKDGHVCGGVNIASHTKLINVKIIPCAMERVEKFCYGVEYS